MDSSRDVAGRAWSTPLAWGRLVRAGGRSADAEAILGRSGPRPRNHASLRGAAGRPSGEAMGPKRRASLLWNFGFAIAIAALTGWVASADLLQRIDLWLYDMTLRAADREGQQTAVVLIDDAAIEATNARELGLPMIAHALHLIAPHRPRAVVFALPLAPIDAEPVEIEALTAEIARFPAAVARLEPWAGSRRQWRPDPRIARHMVDIGHGVFLAASDGVVRSAMLKYLIDGREYLHIGALAARAVAGPEVVPQWDSSAAKPDDFRSRAILFRPSTHARRGIPLSDIIAERASGSELAGRIIVLGSGMSGARTMQTSGRSAQQRNIAEVTADLVDSLLAGDAIRVVTDRHRIALSVLTAFIGAILLPLLRAPYPALTAVASAGTLVAAATVALNLWHWWVPIAVPLAAILAIGVAWSAARGMRSERALSRQLAVIGRHSALERALHGTDPGAGTPIEGRSRLDAAIEAGERIQQLVELLDRLLARLPVGIALHDAAGRIVLHNDMFMDAVSKFDGVPARDGVMPAGLRVEIGAAQVIEADGGGAFSVRAHELPLGDGVRVRATLIADVSDLRAMELQRRNLLGFLGHDIRAPLAAIAAAVDDDNPIAHDGATLRALVRAEAIRALRLAEQFSALVKAESTDLASPGSADFARAVDEALDEVFAQAREAAVRIDRSLPEEAPVVGDQRLLTRAVFNLLDNALRASPRGGRCRVDLLRTGDDWTLRLRNELATDEPIVESSPTRRLGLGLLLVRTIAARSGGGFELRRDGREAVAELRLPVDALARIEHGSAAA